MCYVNALEWHQTWSKHLWHLYFRLKFLANLPNIWLGQLTCVCISSVHLLQTEMPPAKKNNFVLYHLHFSSLWGSWVTLGFWVWMKRELVLFRTNLWATWRDTLETSQSAENSLRQLATITSWLINTSPGNYGASIHSKIQTEISSRRISRTDPFLIWSEQIGDHK